MPSLLRALPPLALKRKSNEAGETSDNVADTLFASLEGILLSEVDIEEERKEKDSASSSAASDGASDHVVITRISTKSWNSGGICPPHEC